MAIQTRPPDTSLAVEIVESVAEQKGSDPTELRPLAHELDTDALETLFASRDRKPVRVSFEYEGYTVHVDSDRTITVE